MNMKEVSPKPVEREQVITGIEISEYQSGIPLRGWESVESALRAFSMGVSRVSISAESRKVLAADPHPIIVPFPKGNFLNQMFKEAKRVTKSQGRWQRDYKDDGAGSFSGTRVGVEKVKRTGDYILKLDVARIGAEAEKDLAEYLGIERGLVWKNVTVKLEPEGDQFRVDFEDMVRRLDGVIDYLNPWGPWEREEELRITGEDVARQLLTNDRDGEGGFFVLGLKDGLEVAIGMGLVGQRFTWENMERSGDKWRVDGSVLTGPLETDYRDETKFLSPSISISIRSETEGRYNRVPVVDPKKKEIVNDLAERVAESFK